MVPRAEPGLVRCSSLIAVAASVFPAGSPGCGWRGGHFRQTEVEDFGVATFGHEDIGGLDVTMNDAFGRGQHRVRQRSGGRDTEILQFQGTAANAVFQGRPPGTPSR